MLLLFKFRLLNKSGNLVIWELSDASFGEQSLKLLSFTLSFRCLQLLNMLKLLRYGQITKPNQICHYFCFRTNFFTQQIVMLLNKRFTNKFIFAWWFLTYTLLLGLLIWSAALLKILFEYSRNQTLSRFFQFSFWLSFLSFLNTFTFQSWGFAIENENWSNAEINQL